MLEILSVEHLLQETVGALESGRYEQGLEKLIFFWDYQKPHISPKTELFAERDAAALLLYCGQLYGMFGVVFKDAQETTKNLLYEAFSIFERIGDFAGQLTASNHLALAYQRMGDYGEARIWIATSFELDFSGDCPERLHTCLIETMIDTSERKYESAIERIERLEIFFRSSEYIYLSAMFYNQKGLAEKNTGMFNSAHESYITARKLCSKIGHIRYKTTLENNLANLCLSKKNLSEAFQWAEMALSSALDTNDLRIIAGVHDTLAGITFAEGNYKLALFNASQAVSEIKRTECYALYVEYCETKIRILLALGQFDTALDELIDASGVEQVRVTGAGEKLKTLFVEYINNNYWVKISRGGNPIAARDFCRLRFELGSAPTASVELIEIFTDSYINYGLEKGDFAIVESRNTENGEFAAVRDFESDNCYLGFVDSFLSLIHLQESINDTNPVSFSNAEIIGKVIGRCSGEPDEDGTLRVLPLQF